MIVVTYPSGSGTEPVMGTEGRREDSLRRGMFLVAVYETCLYGAASEIRRFSRARSGSALGEEKTLKGEAIRAEIERLLRLVDGVEEVFATFRTEGDITNRKRGERGDGAEPKGNDVPYSVIIEVGDHPNPPRSRGRSLRRYLGRVDVRNGGR